MNILPLQEAWAQFSALHALGVFAVYVAVDVAYALYTLYVTRGKCVAAANTSMLIYTLGAFGLISVTSNWLYLLPLATGAWLGTYLVIRHDNNKKDPNDKN